MKVIFHDLQRNIHRLLAKIFVLVIEPIKYHLTMVAHKR
jgi:hypothetical protein